MWPLQFDGNKSIIGSGVGVCILSPIQEVKLLSFKLYFECTNNVVEYESLLLGLNALKTMKSKKIAIYGDSELIVDRVKGIHQAKHPKMRSYRNWVLELLEEFDEYTISLIPMEQNNIADSLASLASLFKIPIYPNKEYQIQVKYRPSIHDNAKNWKVFEDNHQIKRFLENEEEFINTQIEQNTPIVVETISSNNKKGYLNVFAGKTS